MYVLKLGNNAITNDTKIMECDNCGSRFIYNECDVVTGVDVDYASVKYLMCPVCGKHFVISSRPRRW